MQITTIIYYGSLSKVNTYFIQILSCFLYCKCKFLDIQFMYLLLYCWNVYLEKWHESCLSSHSVNTTSNIITLGE